MAYGAICLGLETSSCMWPVLCSMSPLSTAPRAAMLSHHSQRGGDAFSRCRVPPAHRLAVSCHSCAHHQTFCPYSCAYCIKPAPSKAQRPARA